MSKNEILEKLRENGKRVGGRRVKPRKYIIIIDGNVEVKLSPQAITCLDILFTAKKNEMMEEEVAKLMESNAEKFGKTKQTPWKIFQYYRKQLVDSGFLKIEKVENK